jgi:HTH-type transcriptional regulator/antitoxin HigA
VIAPVHPGIVLLDYLQDRGWTQRELAQHMGYTPKHVCELIKGKSRVTAACALKLEHIFQRPAHFWLSLQLNFDLAEARHKRKPG